MIFIEKLKTERFNILSNIIILKKPQINGAFKLS